MSSNSTTLKRLTDVKVFISSTFSDLDKERDYISQIVFHSLREKYKELSINEIDLRWGITEEQAKKGQVIDLCLHYIRESKPFFIGILGDRYGSSFPSNEVVLSPSVETYFPHVRADLESDASATEIEILNGVLRNPEARAIFFIKKNASPYCGETTAQWSRLIKLKDKIKASNHKVVEYNQLKDFDEIKTFIEEYIGPASMYNTPAEGLERADRISQKHYERSLEYLREVPYDQRLDNLLTMIDDTVSQSKRMCAFIGLDGMGKSTTLAYMAHNFTGERIYVPLYGDINDLPSTTQEIEVFLKNTLKNSVFKFRKRKSKWYQFKEWFRDGLNEINYDNFNDLIKEILRHKWCFILDNYDASEWVGYKGFSDTSFSKLREVYNNIIFFFCRISVQFKMPYDAKFMMVRDMSRQNFNQKINWDSNEPVFDLSQHVWFRPQKFIPAFMARHSKNLYPTQLDALIKAPMCMCPGHVRLACKYMIEFVKFDQVDNFVSNVNKNGSIDFVHSLYINKIIQKFGKHVTNQAFIRLFIFCGGIHLQEYEKMLGLNHIEFLFLMRLLAPFIVYTGNGIRLKDFILEWRIISILGLTEDIITSSANVYARQYRKELFEAKGYEEFNRKARTAFSDVAWCFDYLLPEAGKFKKAIISCSINSAWDTRNSLFKQLEKVRNKHWSQSGCLTDEIILKTYRKFIHEYNEVWSWPESTMRNYLMASYSAGRTDWLMDTVHNPYFIKKLWNDPLYLFVWNQHISSDEEFAAPYSPLYDRECYDMKAQRRIMDFLFITFHSKYIRPRLPKLKIGENINLELDYLKNYPKK